MKQQWVKRALAGLAITMIGAAHAQQPQTGSGAQTYPSRPVRLLMPFPAGGPTDILGRLIAQKLTEVWGQNVLDHLESDGPIPVGNSPQEFATHIKTEQAKWSKVIREAHVRIE